MTISYFHGVALAIPSTFVVCFASDFICQELEIVVSKRRRRLAIEGGSKQAGQEKEYNYRRTMIFSTVGGLLFGPMSYSRYLFLDLIMPDGNGLMYVVMKTAASSLAYTPFMTAVGMATNEYLSPNGTVTSVWNRLRNEFWKVLLAGYVFKVITTLITMSFPGTNMKFAVSQVVGMVQNVFTSWRIYAALDEEQQKAKVLDADRHPDKERAIEGAPLTREATDVVEAPMKEVTADKVEVKPLVVVKEG